MKKTLMICSNENAYYFDHVHIPGLSIRGLFKNHAEFNNPVLKFLRKAKSRWTCFFYQDWFENIDSYEKIIVLDVAFSYDSQLLRNIAQKATNSKLYFYSWNIAKDESKFEITYNAVKDSGFQFYSYDRGECEKYGLKFNTIMYDRTLTLQTAHEQYDTLFLGYLKDRKEDILSLYDMFTSAGLTPRFVIVSNGERKEKFPFEYRDDYVGYYDYLKMVGTSRAILDIAQQKQDGYSMRVMEAIFFNKKLVTTNTAVKQSVFYDENNIFIVDLKTTTADELQAFFAKPFRNYSDEVREYYSIEAWVDRFTEQLLKGADCVDIKKKIRRKIEDLPKHYAFIKKMVDGGIQQVAVMGSMHEIGFFEGSINESTPCHPTTPYGIAKNALRDLTQMLCKQKNIVFQWLRGYYIVGNSKFGSSIFSKITAAVDEGKTEFPFTLGQNQYDFIDYPDFCAQVAAVVGQKNEQGIINICSGKPEKLADRVERFIKENDYRIKLQYGAFPDRPYDSKAIWGNDTKIRKIMENQTN